MLSTFFTIVNNLHLISVTLRGISRLVSLAAKSNVGLLGLDRLLNQLGM